jgi:hypothetical protein
MAEKPPPPIGMPPPSEGDAPPSLRADGMDALRSLGSGLVNGTGMLVGVPGDLSRTVADLANSNLPPISSPASDSFLGRFVQFMKDESSKTANDPRTAGIAKSGRGDLPGSYELPTSDQVSSLAKALLGQPYEPQTDFGKMAYTVGQKIPGLPLFALTRGR